ncbi:Hypothetical protein R9X50_00248700 [Acrodontium crateriforme]|uniref:Transcriptional regulatory protein RXT2 N-terminal domain-containing protein n=1 Tax=Acrodontium crateriforme TaxID=150365 RepID=A0AAQ3R6P8_9PEZI|nr:Hypothetical protein R9X50_00248700 [Acrodontium crateriforme]
MNTQVQFAETIRAMKLALRRHAANASDSESDGSLHAHSNRGMKLQRRAQFVREGRLDDTGGQNAYKRRVNHAGYDRYIISKRRKLYDADGDVVDPQDYGSDVDAEDLPFAQPIEEDAFSHVRLEHLLRPLTSAAELQNHPSLSTAYTSTALTQMADDAAEMIRREKASLWKVKRLLRRFRGDGGWLTCGTFSADHDALLLHDGDDRSVQIIGLQSIVPSIATADDGEAVRAQLEREEAATEMEPEGIARQPAENDPLPANGQLMDSVEAHDSATQPKIDAKGVDPTEENPSDQILQDLNNDHDSEQDDAISRTDTNAPSHAMTTRARARSPQNPGSSPSPSPSDSASVPAVHPWFLAPNSAFPDRDLGLPTAEAEETRKLLLLWVQKQENIIRELTSLYEGLQRTDRLRSEVWRACKTEGHMIPAAGGRMVTEMSDGEDWYDPSDWGIRPHELKDGGLEKGKDEVEDAAEEEGRRVGGRRRRVVGR